nr:suppressor of RNA silencing [Sweet potato chlorotic stunt virus]
MEGVVKNIQINADFFDLSIGLIFSDRNEFEKAIEEVCTSESRNRFELLGDWAVTSYVTRVLTSIFKHNGDAESMSLLKAANISNNLFSKIMMETGLYREFIRWMTPDQIASCSKTLALGRNTYEVNLTFLARYFERLVGWLIVQDKDVEVEIFLQNFLQPVMSVNPKKPLRSVLEEWAVKNGKKLSINTNRYNDDKIVKVFVDGLEVSRASDLISKRRAVAKAVSLAVDSLQIR